MIVNTIEFEGRKAVINSWNLDSYPILKDDQERQLAWWQGRYPKASVKAEQLSTRETMDLVAAGKGSGSDGYCYTVGEASEA